jgi:anti-sigma28 factor (negative regulator of flagellin synthesis)
MAVEDALMDRHHGRAKVQALRELIERDEYVVSPRAVADAIMRQARTHAQLFRALDGGGPDRIRVLGT